MKVTNLRRKLAAALMAGGMLAPAAAMAADLDTNLVTNPGFENLDATDSHILNWTDGSGLGLTYTSGLYDNGGPLASGGSFYFTSNTSIGGADVDAAGAVAQLIDVSTGDSATLIASGNAFYNGNAFFSSYLDNGDFGTVQLDFLDSGAGTLASRTFGSVVGLQTWTQLFGAAPIPVGTESIMVSVFGTALSGGPDGYIDNVDVQVSATLSALDLRVDRDDGSLILSNRTGSPVNISGYQLTSAFEGLDPAGWVSIAENYDADSGGSEVDGTNVWTELTQAGAHGDLSEADLASGSGGALADSQSINLGNAGTWIRNPNEDLVLQYISNGTIVNGIVSFADLGPFVVGDVDTDSDVDTDDWAIVRANQHTNLSGKSLAEAYRMGDLTGDLMNNYPDFVAFKEAFDGANGVGAFQAMIGAVPEPSTLLLLMTGGLFVLPALRRGTARE